MTEGNQQAMELSDEQLMARVAARDSVAFGLLYDRHAAVVLGIAVKIVGDRTVGEEVLQETYWRVWTQAATFDPAKGPLRAWLCRRPQRPLHSVPRSSSRWCLPNRSSLSSSSAAASCRRSR